MRPRHLLVCVSFLTLSACGGGRGSDVDAGPSADAASADATRVDGAAGHDGGGTTDGGAASDAGTDLGTLPDGAACVGSFAECAEPPAGFTHCGGGAIDPAMARAACDAVDPPFDLHMGLTKSCAAFTIVDGHYDVWCGPDAIYVWASLDLASTDVTTCMLSATLPDGGIVTGTVYRLTWGISDSNTQLYANVALPGGSSAGGMAMHVGWPFAPEEDTAPDATHWTGSLALDGRLTVGAGVTSGTGTLYYTSGSRDCDGVPTSAMSIVLAVPISFGS